MKQVNECLFIISIYTYCKKKNHKYFNFGNNISLVLYNNVCVLAPPPTFWIQLDKNVKFNRGKRDGIWLSKQFYTNIKTEL